MAGKLQQVGRCVWLLLLLLLKGRVAKAGRGFKLWQTAAGGALHVAAAHAAVLHAATARCLLGARALLPPGAKAPNATLSPVASIAAVLPVTCIHPHPAVLLRTALLPAQARELMMKGCEMCPNNEDVWLEAARLQVRWISWD